MNHIRQPNGWTCQPAAFAMCMDCSLQAVLDAVGHDGSAINSLNATSVIWTVECFTPAEMALAAYKLGYAVVEFEAVFFNHHGRRPKQFPGTINALVSTFAPGTRFVLTIGSPTPPAKYHAVAYEADSNIYHDPLCPEPRLVRTCPPIYFVAAILKLGEPHGSVSDQHSTARRQSSWMATSTVCD